MAETLPALLRRLRAERGLTQRQLAERAGLTQSTVASLEARSSRGVTVPVVLALADALGASVEDLARAAARDAR